MHFTCAVKELRCLVCVCVRMKSTHVYRWVTVGNNIWYFITQKWIFILKNISIEKYTCLHLILFRLNRNNFKKRLQLSLRPQFFGVFWIQASLFKLVYVLRYTLMLLTLLEQESNYFLQNEQMKRERKKKC